MSCCSNNTDEKSFSYQNRRKYAKKYPRSGTVLKKNNIYKLIFKPFYTYIGTYQNKYKKN